MCNKFNIKTSTNERLRSVIIKTSTPDSVTVLLSKPAHVSV